MIAIAVFVSLLALAAGYRAVLTPSARSKAFTHAKHDPSQAPVRLQMSSEPVVSPFDAQSGGAADPDDYVRQSTHLPQHMSSCRLLIHERIAVLIFIHFISRMFSNPINACMLTSIG
jgi:hypothetical protein